MRYLDAIIGWTLVLVGATVLCGLGGCLIVSGLVILTYSHEFEVVNRYFRAKRTETTS